MSTTIDEQLRDLGGRGTGLSRGQQQAQDLAEKQRRAIEQATGQEATRFLTQFKQAARRDLCEPGGILNTQWKKWKDISNKDMIKTFGGVLVGMGLTGSALQIVVVAVAVYLLYIGIEAFCRDV